MQTILILGTGKSSTYLIDYLIETAKVKNRQIILADISIEIAAEKSGNSPYVIAKAINLNEKEMRITYNVRRTADLSGKYKKFEVTISMRSVFGSKGDAFISDLKSSNFSDMDDTTFLRTFGKSANIRHRESAKVTFQSR
jgi:hypothetical protein